VSTKPREEAVSLSLSRSQFDSLVEALRNLVKVCACAQIRWSEGTERNARFLRVFGLTEQEIADLLGITQQAVNKALSRSKQKKRPRQ